MSLDKEEGYELYKSIDAMGLWSYRKNIKDLVESAQLQLIDELLGKKHLYSFKAFEEDFEAVPVEALQAKKNQLTGKEEV